MMQVRVRRPLQHLPRSAWFMSGKLNWPAKLVPSKQVLLLSISILYGQYDLSVWLWSFCSSISFWSARMNRFFMLYWEFYLLCDRPVQRKGFLRMHAQESYASAHCANMGNYIGSRNFQSFHWVKEMQLVRSARGRQLPLMEDLRGLLAVACRQCSTTSLYSTPRCVYLPCFLWTKCIKS